MPPTLDVDHLDTESKHHRGHFDARSSIHSQTNGNRYDLQHHKSHLNSTHNQPFHHTLAHPHHHHNHQHHNHNLNSLNDRHNQTMVAILPSQLTGYNRSSASSHTNDPHHLGHQQSHSFSHTNSFTSKPMYNHHHNHNQFSSSRFPHLEKNDSYLHQHNKQQQLHNCSTSTSRRSHHSQHNSKSRMNDYIKISDCQSSAPQASNYLEASYMLAQSHTTRSNDRLQSRSTEYKQVDFIKTEALEDLRVEKADRERGKST